MNNCGIVKKMIMPGIITLFIVAGIGLVFALSADTSSPAEESCDAAEEKKDYLAASDAQIHLVWDWEIGIYYPHYTNIYAACHKIISVISKIYFINRKIFK
jgi:hypothetical protein